MIPIELTTRECDVLLRAYRNVSQVIKNSADDQHLDTGDAVEVLMSVQKILDRILWRAMERDDL